MQDQNPDREPPQVVWPVSAKSQQRIAAADPATVR